MRPLDRLLDSEFVEYLAAAGFLVIWWLVSKTVYTVKRLRGQLPPDDDAERRPRRRIPLY